MGMQQIENNVEYYRRHRNMEARQEILRASRGSYETSNPTPNTLQIEKLSVSEHYLAEASLPKEQPVTIFEKPYSKYK